MVSQTCSSPRGRALVVERAPAWIRRGTLLALGVVLWQACASLSELAWSPLPVASPVETARAVGSGWVDGSLARATGETLRALILGVAIGAPIAGALAVLALLSRVGERGLELTASITSWLPSVAVLALALLWLGPSTEAIVVAAATATVWPLATDLTTGLTTASPRLLAVGRSIGLSKLRLVTDVLAPAAWPHALSGLRTAWRSGWLTVVAAELVLGVAGRGSGLGSYVANAQRDQLPAQLVAALLAIAILSVLFEVGFGLLERRTIVRWGIETRSASGKQPRLQ